MPPPMSSQNQNGTYRSTMTEATASSLFTVDLPSGETTGGFVLARIHASDGTDHQSMQVIVTFAAVNKAGTITRAITNLSTTDAKAVSTGTLTLSWTCTDDTNKITVKVAPTGSLTESTGQYYCDWSVFMCDPNHFPMPV